MLNSDRNIGQQPRLDISGLLSVRSTAPESITVLLSRVSGGDREAFNNLIPLVYQELRRIAAGYLRRESQNFTLHPTALIHEPYLRLVQSGGVDYHSRWSFFGVSLRLI